MKGSNRRKCFSIYICTFLTSLCLLGQTPSRKMIQLETIYSELREGFGSEYVVANANNKLKKFHSNNAFTSDMSEISFSVVAGKENLCSCDGHVIYLPEYFDQLLKNKDGVFIEAKKIIEEWNKAASESSRGFGYTFRQYNFAQSGKSSVTFQMTLNKGPFDVLAIAEPMGLLTMKIYNVTSGVYLTDNEDLKNEREGKGSRRKTMYFDERTTIRVTIHNTTNNVVSMAIVCF